MAVRMSNSTLLFLKLVNPPCDMFFVHFTGHLYRFGVVGVAGH